MKVNGCSAQSPVFLLQFDQIDAGAVIAAKHKSQAYEGNRENGVGELHGV